MKKKEELIETSNIIPRSVNAQFRDDYGRYGYYVAYHRVTPNCNDGLIPVKRAVIIAAHLLAKVQPESTMKSATIVGMILRIHPHGDASAYQTLVNMANTFNCKYQLIRKHGSFGTVDGDKAADMRYTECTLSAFCYDVLLAELGRTPNTDFSVDWVPNYSKEIMIPSYLPARLPLLFLNGSENIGVGDKVDVSSHNITEVIDTLLRLLKNPNDPCVLIPDHCQECEIIDTNWKDIAKHGSGRYKVRAKIEVCDYMGNNKEYFGHQMLRITSLPNFVYMNSIMAKIDELINDNKIIQIKGYENKAVLNKKTEETNVDMWFILQPGSDPEYVKSLLYSKTDLQKTFSINLNVLDRKTRLHLNYNQYFNMFLNYRRVTKVRILANKLQALQTENARYQSYIDLIQSGKLDAIEKFVRKYKTGDEGLEEAVTKKFDLNPLQARFVLDSKIRTQASSALKTFQGKLSENLAEIKDIDNTIRSNGVDMLIEQELLDLRKKYAEPRKCKVIKDTGGKPSGIFRLVVTESNKMKCINLSDEITVGKGDSIKIIMDVDISEDLIVYTSNGKVYKVPLEKIPHSPKNTSGEDIRLINKNIMADIINIGYLPAVEEAYTRKEVVVCLSKSGLIKRMLLDDFLNIALSGTTYCKLDPGDFVMDVCVCPNNMNMMVYNKETALLIPVDSIPMTKRISKGSMSMKSDSVEGMCAIIPGMTDLLIVTSKGFINRINPASISQGRAKKGSTVVRLKQGDSIKSIIGTTSDHVLRVYCVNEIRDIPVAEIKAGSTISGGTKMITNASGDIIKVALL